MRVNKTRNGFQRSIPMDALKNNKLIDSYEEKRVRTFS